MPDNTPCDWDHQSLCIEDDCTNPATHSRLHAVTNDGTPIAELICCQHAMNGQ